MRSAFSSFTLIHWSLFTESMPLSVWPLNTHRKYPNYKVHIGLTLRIPTFGKNPQRMNTLIRHFVENKNN